MLGLTRRSTREHQDPGSNQPRSWLAGSGHLDDQPWLLPEPRCSLPRVGQRHWEIAGKRLSPLATGRRADAKPSRERLSRVARGAHGGSGDRWSDREVSEREPRSRPQRPGKSHMRRARELLSALSTGAHIASLRVNSPGLHRGWRYAPVSPPTVPFGYTV